ncbi:phosphate/phosphite/phosphonate ABC transporter substrate-binding protein [Paenibacillus antri]|uniref:Phosphate/phosphite/phosphonate ABC transporter substrate-binding protein n=1 Tax=Paenibacillus antri TaxID=2582848 RepID=A0A5R9GHS5_9BACL|nr:phosphate/phosphite/phosphonate ABC transporter substrate-binding protein [Paenibacillus antri]TLS52954.1 phosphate/phosphite/phosphonate ABC transporter substrate-binding protein [Paenibacillus antri]
MKFSKTALLALLSIILALTALTGCAGSGAKADEPFKIAVIPVQTEGQLGEAMKKLQTILSDALDREVEISDYPDYNGVVEAMNFGHVDMAFFGPLTYVVAHHKSGAEAIVVQLVKGKPLYYSYIITHKDNPWNSLDELFADPGAVSFAFGDPSSTSGSLVPGVELKARGVLVSETESKLKEVRYTGSHDITAIAVQNKDVDAGAIDSAIYDNLVEQGTIDGNQFKVIWQSEELYQYPWAVKKGMDAELIKKLQDTFVSITDESILSGFGISGFAPTSNEDYESIRVVAEKEGRLE